MVRGTGLDDLESDPKVDFDQLMRKFESNSESYRGLRQFTDEIDHRRRELESTWTDLVRHNEQAEKMNCLECLPAAELSSAQADVIGSPDIDRYKSALDTINAIERIASERLDELATERYLNDPTRYRSGFA